MLTFLCAPQFPSTERIVHGLLPDGGMDPRFPNWPLQLSHCSSTLVVRLSFMHSVSSESNLGCSLPVSVATSPLAQRRDRCPPSPSAERLYGPCRRCHFCHALVLSSWACISLVAFPLLKRLLSGSKFYLPHFVAAFSFKLNISFKLLTCLRIGSSPSMHATVPKSTFCSSSIRFASDFVLSRFFSCLFPLTVQVQAGLLAVNSDRGTLPRRRRPRAAGGQPGLGGPGISRNFL